MKCKEYTAEYLHSLFEYVEGKLFWKIKPALNVYVGDEAGCVNAQKYVVITIENTQYKRHRIIYAMFYDKWPKLIDHINQIRGDDYIENLRELDLVSNLHNTSVTYGKIPFRGVYFNKASGVYRAFFQLRGVRKFLGGFDTPEKASSVYQNYKKELTNSLYDL